MKNILIVADGIVAKHFLERLFVSRSSTHNYVVIACGDEDYSDVNLENFSDNTEAFMAILTKIAAFADEIECENFGECFRRALKSLRSSSVDDQKIFNAPLMPKKNLALFAAASLADVFGGMGSWNDDAAGMAQYKKRGKEYEELSNELFTQIRKAILFAVNEW